jgi:GNAT superfamily N-acetyltransferase
MAVMPDWWDGRDLRPMVPKLFLFHFNDTAFIIEKESRLIGFLIGFLSQSRMDEAYIHFVGIRPDHRSAGLGSMLYERFFTLCRKHQRSIIRACTSPVNKGSIIFHEKMDFQIASGNGEVDGIPVTLDYNRQGDHKVLFVKKLSTHAEIS